MHDEPDTYDEASRQTVELGNRLADADEQADLWDVSDGLLAGAIQFWLYSRQPCDDPACEQCAPMRTAEWRLAELKRLTEEMARSSDYFHAPTDLNAGRA